jgi:signal transduction histidine kinase
MRKSVFLLLLLTAVMPFIAMLGILFFYTPLQQEGLAHRRLASTFFGVSGYFDKLGVDILSQARALGANEALTNTLMQADTTGFFNQPLLIESIVKQLTLLNLDYLMITDPQGVVIAQGHEPTVLGFSALYDSLVARALSGQELHTLGQREIKGRLQVEILSATPVWFRNRVIGSVVAGVTIDERYLDEIKGLTGAELVLVSEGAAKGSTIQGGVDQDIIFMQNDIIRSVEYNGESFRFASFPLSDFSAKKIADIMIGVNITDIATLIRNLSRTFVVFALCAIVMTVVLSWGFTSKVSRQIADLGEGFSGLGSGDFELSVKTSRTDELGSLVKSFNSLVADLRDRQEKLIDYERMATLTQMAERIAHQITMPTQIVRGALAEIKRASSEKGENQSAIIEKNLAVVSSEMTALSKIVEEFSEFVKFPVLAIERQSISGLIASLITDYQDEIKSNNLVIHSGDHEFEVSMDKALIRRAIDAILQNSFEAAGPTGVIELRTYTAKGFVVIEITDSGQGFSSLAKKNLFAPFFSTKPDGRGLSMVMAKKIMTEHDGTIEIDDNIGGGAVVRLKLKLAEEA